MAAKRIGLFGLFGSGNLGNDGSLEAMLDFLRSAMPDAELVCICSGDAKVRREFDIPTIRIGGEPATDPVLRALQRVPPVRKLRQWLHALRTARGLNALIVPGTGILDDYGENCWGMPATLLGWCLAARLGGAKVAFVCVGAGPIRHPVSRLLMKTAARLAHYRSYRDALSRDFMESIGLDTRKDPICRDIAFRLPVPAGTAAPAGGPAPLTVGLGVMTYFGWRADPLGGAEIYDGYLRKIARFTLWLLDQGHRVRILMGEDTDQRAVDDLMKCIATQRPGDPRERVVAEPAQSLRELMRQIAETQVVVATRYHNVVCALKLGKPTISLGYAKKNDVLMADMDLGEFCQHVERFDVDLLIEQFTSLVSSRADYEESMRAANADFAGRLADQERVLLERVLQ